jgi:hypothetical protein
VIVADATEHSDAVAIPHLTDIEIVSGIGGRLLEGRLAEDQAALDVRGFRTLPLLRFDLGPLLARCWELRASLTSYDGAYVLPGHRGSRARWSWGPPEPTATRQRRYSASTQDEASELRRCASPAATPL